MAEITLIDLKTNAPAVFKNIDQARFDVIATEAVNACADKGQKFLREGIDRGRSSWPRLTNWTMLLRFIKGITSSQINFETGDYYRAIEVRKGAPRMAEVGILNDKGSKGQPLHKIAAVMEGGATIQITERMRGWFGAHGLHFRASTSYVYIPPRPVFGTALPEMEDEVPRLMGPYVKQMEALFS